jgi:hypothetical protein
LGNIGLKMACTEICLFWVNETDTFFFILSKSFHLTEIHSCLHLIGSEKLSVFELKNS